MRKINTLNIPMNKKILEAGLAVKDYTLQKYNKVFVKRMDVRFPPEQQQDGIRRFMKRFAEKERTLYEKATDKSVECGVGIWAVDRSVESVCAIHLSNCPSPNR